MKFRFAPLLGCALLVTLQVHAQLLPQSALDTVRTFRTLERALKDPGSVYKLDLSGKKLKELPPEVRELRNLNILELGSNRLKDLPAWLAELPHLQVLKAPRNRFKEFPAVICQLKHLKRLDLSRNSLIALPECIGDLTELFALDLWSNDLGDFPESMSRLEALRFMDLRAIQFEQHEMDRIQELVPRAKIYFSAPCNCGIQ